jgi:hypothetical protein
MKRILSERNLVVIVFISALVIFFFAQQDIEKAHQFYNSEISVMPSAPSKEASTEVKVPAQKPAPITESKQ